jgi:hypothetical protein
LSPLIVSIGELVLPLFPLVSPGRQSREYVGSQSASSMPRMREQPAAQASALRVQAMTVR